MSSIDLYNINLTGAHWARPCGSETPGSSDPGQDSCVEYTEIPGRPGAYAIRDSKLGDDSPILCFDADEWANFRSAAL